MSDLDFLKPFLRDHVLEKGSLSNEGKRHLTLVYSYWLKLLSIYFNDVGVTSRSIKVLKETIKESPDNSVPYAIHAFYNQSRRSAEINKKKKLNFFFALLLLRVILFLNDNSILISLKNTSLSTLHGFLVCSALILYSSKAKYLPAADLTLLSLTEVLGGILWVWIPWFGVNEIPSVNTLIGGGIIVSAIVFYGLNARRFRFRY